MAFSWKITDRINFGNKKMLAIDLTDVQDDGTSVITLSGWNRIDAVHAVNNTDSSDTFTPTIGSHGGATTKKQVTFTSVSDDDDGHAIIWGR